jgi:hypothetical protein
MSGLLKGGQRQEEHSMGAWKEEEGNILRGGSRG